MSGSTSYEETLDDQVLVLEKREIGPFHSVSMSGVGSLVLTQAETPGLWVETNRNSLDSVLTTVDGGVLNVRSRTSQLFAGARDLTIYLNMPDIHAIALSGSVKCQNRSTLSLDHLELRGAGASSCDLSLITGQLSSRLSGAFRLDLAGSAESHHLTASGAVKLSGLDFITNTTNIRASGAVRAEVNAEHELSAKISGAVKVLYSGRAEHLTEKTAGVAKISRAGG